MRPTAGAVALLLLLSCGSSDEAGGPIPFEGMPAALRKTLCRKLYSCCSAEERKTNPVIGKDLASCEATLGGYSTFLLADLKASVVEGRAVYHGDRMASCLAAIEAESCDRLKMPPGGLDPTTMCNAAIEPKVPAGGSCSEYWDCIDGWCAGDAGGLKDTCIARKANEDPCDESPECRSGSCEEHVCLPAEQGGGNICELGTAEAGH
jgi:hypothetical protein